MIKQKTSLASTDFRRFIMTNWMEPLMFLAGVATGMLVTSVMILMG